MITNKYRQTQTRLVNSVLSEKDILELELGWLGRLNFLGEIIYQSMMQFVKETDEFKRIKDNLRYYQVKAHDKSGSLLYDERLVS